MNDEDEIISVRRLRSPQSSNHSEHVIGSSFPTTPYTH